MANYFYTINEKIVILFFLIGLFLNFIFLLFIYRKHGRESTPLATMIKTVWWSLVISFSPFALLSFIPQLLFSYDWVSSLYTSIFVLFFPLSFAYLILAKKLYDIDLVLRRVLFTVMLSIVPSICLVAIHTLIFQYTLTSQHIALSFIFTVMTIAFILYSFEYFTTKLEFIIFPRKYYLNRAMKKIANNLCSISSFRELKEMVLVDIVNTLQVFGAAIVYKYQDRIETVTEGQISLPAIEGSADVEAWNYPSLLRFEINRHEEYTSYLIMTDKKTNTALSKEDMQWLNFIISYLAVSLENMHLIHKLNMRLQQLASQMPSEQSAQELVWFRKLMFELQEDERRRIATDLHDTTMQDLFFLKKRFASLIEKPEFPQQDIEQMKGILDYVEIINTNLRQNCFELHPHLLHEIGLINTLRKLVEHETPICPFQLEFMAQGAERIEDRDLDAKRHVFRIVQELLNNAKKHSLASIVSITLTAEGNNFLLVYKDDGIGLQAQSETSREIGSSGTGLEQMRSRILSLNGQLNIRKDMESGVYLSVTIPMRKVA
ncbi:histidine kinase [Paenibacillus sp. WQ 127069]|uniref:histidine kinase n=1 Tax=Paenibacillus baimaensis TaxID=2982185 RepID=A0ABT2UED8_9BACL|nr:ATP-binding protein [Paenibacillus sp. WQ 127069]MCU6793018.1 histidine kinase [Paenibacillus sp. WQ 127069]